MNELTRLSEIEAIRALKARYWIGVDTKDWDLYGSTLDDDILIDFRADRALANGLAEPDERPIEIALQENVEGVARGRATVLDAARNIVSEWTTVHQGHAPHITIIDETHAKAIWPMTDIVSDGVRTLTGHGFYHEDYIKRDGHWRISFMKLSRLRMDGDYPLSSWAG